MYNPYDTFKKLSKQWEKQVNDYIHLWTNTEDFVSLSKLSTESHANFIERLRKNQELLATQLNIPTKKDLANVSKLTIQTEEKLDNLEEQIWSLADSVQQSNKEVEGIIEISNEVIKITKRLRTEMNKSKKEIETVNELKEEIVSLKKEVATVSSLKEEIASLKELIIEGSFNSKPVMKEKELVVSGQEK